MQLIGRALEQKLLQEMLNSTNSEFLAVYGRRRIGKTFLIREYFKNKNGLFFNITGAKDASLKDQIKHFTEEIARVFYNNITLTPGKNWDETFSILTKALTNLSKKKKVVLFFDELPWMATKNSKLLQTLDYYWNQYWSRNPKVKLIICGSSSSWIVDKVINNKGGLYNRITRQIHLQPFTLKEVKSFFNNKNIKLTNNQICKIYMAMGGVPHYLNYIQRGKSAAQNIDLMAFTKNGILAQEFDKLFASLFDMHELCIQLILIIAESNLGINQEEIFKKIGTKGYVVLQKLKELQSAGFITKYIPYQRVKKGIYYKITDEYTLFYLKWIKPIKDSLISESSAKGYFESQQNTPKFYNWAGYAFESICYKHIEKIRERLGLDVSAIPYPWWINNTAIGLDGAQIDLLFDRIDDSITICEIKFTNQSFNIDKQYAKDLERKIRIFKDITKTKKQIFLAIISANGVRNSKYLKELVSKVVTLDDLF